MKQCNSCKEILPLDNFRLVKRSNRNDEIYCKCRSCEKTYYRERRRSRSEVETLRTRGWRSRNPEKAKASVKNWRANNKEAVRRLDSERRAREGQAIPPWYEKREVQELYKRAVELGWHVDHIVPLTHRLVCGLHCMANLQLLSPEDNLKKGNKFKI